MAILRPKECITCKKTKSVKHYRRNGNNSDFRNKRCNECIAESHEKMRIARLPKKSISDRIKEYFSLQY